MSEEKALTTVEQGSALALPPDFNDSVAGEENLRQGDIGMPPRLRISQQNRPIDGTQPGEIANTLTGAVSDVIEFVPMVFLPTTRVMWPEQFSADNQPLCVSDDGENPLRDLNRATNPQRGPCATCPYSQFSDDGTPPKCKAQRNFLVLQLPDYEPAIVTLSSTGIAAAKQLTALAKMGGLRKSLRMATRKVEDTRGTWFVPVFVVGEKLPVEEVLMVAEFRDELQNLVITADVEAPTNGHDSQPGDDAAYDDIDEVPF